jgi:Outer membrane protein beta-barrel domain
MKKAFFATILTVSVIAASAQINQGQWLVGGNVNFTSAKQGDNKQTHINFSPDAGYFFIHNFAGGLRVNVSSDKPDGGDASTLFTVAPFVRYYFLPSGQKVNVFADAQYGFGSGKTGGTSESINQYQIAAGPAVFLTPHTALEFTVFYASMGGKYYEGAGSDRWNEFGVNIGFQIHLGEGGGNK